MPGPGHYQLNIPDQIKTLTDKMAPRYKQNPFGSHISRFNHHEKKDKKTEIVTEDDLRVQELIKDLEEHTGINKEKRQNVTFDRLKN